jgi:hypothetical protein
MRLLHQLAALVPIVVTLSCELQPPEEPAPTLVVTPPMTTVRTNVWVAAPQATPTTVPAEPTGGGSNGVDSSGVVSNGVGVTTFQMRQLLGHYTTLDGKTGFVLDRTVDPPRARMDGDPYVKNLEVRPSIHCCVEYAAAGLWMRVDKDTGAVLEFVGSLQGARPVRVIRDADAVPLSTP